MKKHILFISVMILVMISSLAGVAQTTEKTVTLVVSGDGATKEEAVKQALRSALEQVFGTFISANTEVLNDEIIRDEIVTVSSGNITKYKVIDTCRYNDGSYNVTVDATVSIDKLTNFALNNGMSADISTGAFAMNMRIRELNKENEVHAIKDLQTKLRKMGSQYNYFDYHLDLSEPYMKRDDYAVKATILIKPNKNLAHFRNAIVSTLKSLSLSEMEQEEYTRANIPFTKFAITDYDSDEELLASMEKPDATRYKNAKYSVIALRNTDTAYPLLYFPVLFLNNQLKVSLEDNTGSYFAFMYTIDRHRGEQSAPYDVAHVSTPLWPVYDFDPAYRNPSIEWYVYNLGCTKGLGNMIQSKLFCLNEFFDFTLLNANDPIGNPMMTGPAKLEFEMIFPKDHFLKINDISIKYRRPHYYER